METEILKALLDDLSEMTKANHEMSISFHNLQADAEKTIAGYREELHTAKARVEASESKVLDLMKRCDRLQEKYDALHEKYDRLVDRTLDKSNNGGSRADVKVNI